MKHHTNQYFFNCVYLFLYLLATKLKVLYLGDQSRVAHGRGQAYSQPLEVAVDNVWLGDKTEGAQISQTYSSQDDVAQLTTGWLDHRGVPKSADKSILSLYICMYCKSPNICTRTTYTTQEKIMNLKELCLNLIFHIISYRSFMFSSTYVYVHGW